MRLRVFSLALLMISVTARKHHHSSEEDEDPKKDEGEKIVDRLAINMAGAFVKSMFPEMDRGEKKESAPSNPSEIRRAPPMGLDPSMEGYNANSAMSNYNALPQQNQMGSAPGNPFAYQSQTPYQMSQGASGMGGQAMGGQAMGGPGMGGGAGAMPMGGIPALLAGGGNSGTPEGLNAVRNQQYLAELARHQAELNAYSAKQMEYLDNQRRYQQTMIDHQAGAALLMQKQQQEAINEQMKQLKSSYGQEEHFTNDNTVGGRVLSRARGVKTHAEKPPRRVYTDDDISTNDEHLQQFFREYYGIDFHAQGAKLTDDERETLKQLRKELVKNKEKTIEKGTFKTMEALKSKVTSRARSSTSGSSSERLASAPEESEICPQCIAIDMSMIRGAWTQMYGNPAVIKKTFGTLMSLERLNMARGTTMMSNKKAACVGMEVGKFSQGAASFNMFYRDNGEGNELHEMKGKISKDSSVNVNIDTDMYHTKMCLVKAGPSEAERFEYVVLAETSGKNACRSYHVFARHTDEFNRRHFDDVSEFMKNEVLVSDILPVGAFAKAPMCQLDSP